MYNFFVLEHNCVKLTHCSAHLGSWFVAVGNAELNIKLMLYVMDQEVFVFKTFWCFLCCCGKTVLSFC